MPDRPQLRRKPAAAAGTSTRSARSASVKGSSASVKGTSTRSARSASVEGSSASAEGTSTRSARSASVKGSSASVKGTSASVEGSTPSGARTPSAAEVPQQVARFGRWHLLLVFIAAFLGSQVINSVRQVLAEGGATWFGTTLRIVLGAIAVLSTLYARTSVRIDEDGVRVRPWLLPRRALGWREISEFRVEHVAAPSATQVLRYLSLSAFDVMHVTAGPERIRMRIPRGAEPLVMAYADAFADPDPEQS